LAILGKQTYYITSIWGGEFEFGKFENDFTNILRGLSKGEWGFDQQTWPLNQAKLAFL
jgi:hypothetical protein